MSNFIQYMIVESCEGKASDGFENISDSHSWQTP